MDKFEKYLDEGTEKLLEMISSLDMDANEKDAIVNAFVSELSENIGNADGITDYEPLIYAASLKYTDETISGYLSAGELSYSDYDKALLLCKKQKKLVEMFSGRNWPLPVLVNTQIDLCIDKFEKRRESVSITTKIIEEDKRIDELVYQARKELSTAACDNAIAQIRTYEEDIAACKQRNILIPPLNNKDPKKLIKSLTEFRNECEGKEALHERMLEADLKISNISSLPKSTHSQWAELISLCINLENYIGECKNKQWPLPTLKCTHPSELITKYKHYQEMLVLDKKITEERTGLVSNRQYKTFFSDCEDQNRNIDICTKNGWELPDLINSNPRVLRDKVNLEKEKRDKTKKLKYQLIIAAFVVCLVLVLIMVGIHKYRENRVQVPLDIISVAGTDYLDIKEAFEEAGFQNVNAIPDVSGWEQSGSVIAITIGGSDSVSKGTYVKPEVSVEIRYSSQGRNDISQYLNGWESREYLAIKAELEDNGYTRISLSPVDTFDQTQNHLVSGLVLNGSSYTSGDCFLPADAPIEIQYYILKIAISGTNTQFVGQNYSDVVNRLKEDGFTNIQAEEIKTGWMEGNTVISVLINNSTDYEISQPFEPDSKIIVKYSSNDRSDITSLLTEWQNRDYGDLQNELRTAGFTDITVVAKSTEDKTNNQLIASLQFNGENFVGGNCYLQKSAQIVIEYYVLNIKIEKAASDFTKNIEGYYSTVVQELKDLGFTNIKVMRANDLMTGFVNKEGSVESITIGGNSDFTSEDNFAFDEEVVLIVHTFKKKGCEDITLIAE